MHFNELSYDSFIATLRRNNSIYTHLNLAENDFLRLAARADALCRVIQGNTTCTYLSFATSEVSDNFLRQLCNAMRVNETVCMIDFSPKQTIEASLQAELSTYLSRNRKKALEKPLPELAQLKDFVESMTPEFRLKNAITAIHTNHLNMLYSLVLHNKALLEMIVLSVKNNDETLLSYAIWSGQLDCVKLLLAMGASPNFLFEDKEKNAEGQPITIIGDTYLSRAARYNQLVIAEVLLINGAHVNQIAFSRTALHMVKTVEMAALLIKYGANPQALVTNADNIAHSELIGVGDSALHSACQASLLTGMRYKQNYQLIRFFLEQGLPVNAQNHCLQTPLHCFIVNHLISPNKHFFNTMNLFLLYGANPLIRDHRKHTLAYINDQPKAEAGRKFVGEYAQIEIPCVAYKQSQRDKTCLFGTLPQHIIEDIIDRCAPTENITPATKTAIIKRLLR